MPAVSRRMTGPNRVYALVALALCASIHVWAQKAEPGNDRTANAFDPRVTFAPLTLPEPVNGYRLRTARQAGDQSETTDHRRDHHLHQQQPGRASKPLDPTGAKHLPQRFAVAPGKRHRASWTSRR